MTHFRVSREDLYEMVWARPVGLVADDFGLLDKGLAKGYADKLDPLP